MESSSTGRTEWRHTAVHCQHYTRRNTGDISVPHKHYQHYCNIPSTIHNIFLHHCSKNSHRKWPIQPLLFYSNTRKRSAINIHEYHCLHADTYTVALCMYNYSSTIKTYQLCLFYFQCQAVRLNTLVEFQ